MITLKKKVQLIDDLIKEDSDTTIKDYLETIEEIEKIINTNYGPTTRPGTFDEPGKQNERKADTVFFISKRSDQEAGDRTGKASRSADDPVTQERI